MKKWLAIIAVNIFELLRIIYYICMAIIGIAFIIPYYCSYRVKKFWDEIDIEIEKDLPNEN